MSGFSRRVFGESVLCWGRETDIELLCSRIYSENAPRSLTLVHGDSGIGKTTLLRALQQRVNEPSVFCGYYEAQPGAGYDPLWLALDDLLMNHVYGIPNWQQQVRVAVTQAKASLQNPKKLQVFALEASGAIIQSIPLGKIAGPISAALGGSGVFSKLVGAMSKLAQWDQKRVEMFTSSAAADLLGDVLKILTDAYPTHRFVLLIDNVNADAQSLGASPERIRNLDTLSGFIATRFRRLTNVHLIATWKSDALARTAFERFQGYVLECGGRMEQLGPINDEAVGEWLDQAFPWFARAEGQSRRRVLELSRGLPQVISWWQEQRVEACSLHNLQELARDAINRKFTWIRGEAIRDPNRAFLFQLVSLTVSLPPESWSDLIARERAWVIEYFQSWCDRGLLTRSRGSFEFAHETRRMAVLDALASELGLSEQQREDLTGALMNALLDHADLGEAIHPRSAEYTAVAKLLSDSVPTLGQTARRVRAFLGFLEEPTCAVSAAILHDLLLAPRNVKYLFYKAAAESSVVEYLPDLEAALRREIENLPLGSYRRTKYTRTLLRGRANLGDTAACEELGRELRSEFDSVCTLHEAEEQYALALIDALAISGNAHHLDDVNRNFLELKRLYKKDPTCNVFRLAFCHGSMNRLNTDESVKTLSPSEVARTRLDVQLMWESSQSDPMLAEMFARCLYHENEATRGRARDTLNQLKTLHTAWPNSFAIAQDLVRAAGLFLLDVAHNGTPLASAMQDFDALESYDGERVDELLSRQAVLFADAAALCKTAGRVADADYMIASCRKLYSRQPTPGVGIGLARSLVINILKERPGIEAAIIRLRELLDLLDRFPCEVKLARMSASMIIYIMSCRMNTGNLESQLHEVTKDLEGMRSLRKLFPDDHDLGDQSKVAHRSFVLRVKQSKAVPSPDILEELKELSMRWPPDDIPF